MLASYPTQLTKRISPCESDLDLTTLLNEPKQFNLSTLEPEVLNHPKTGPVHRLRLATTSAYAFWNKQTRPKPPLDGAT